MFTCQKLCLWMLSVMHYLGILLKKNKPKNKQYLIFHLSVPSIDFKISDNLENSSSSRYMCIVISFGGYIDNDSGLYDSGSGLYISGRTH